MRQAWGTKSREASLKSLVCTLLVCGCNWGRRGNKGEIRSRKALPHLIQNHFIFQDNFFQRMVSDNMQDLSDCGPMSKQTSAYDVLANCSLWTFIVCVYGWLLGHVFVWQPFHKHLCDQNLIHRNVCRSRVIWDAWTNKTAVQNSNECSQILVLQYLVNFFLSFSKMMAKC